MPLLSQKPYDKKFKTILDVKDIEQEKRELR